MIGIFDSGIGGLTVARALMERLPKYQYLYLGDNARAPYGDHSQEIIFRHTTEALTYLFDHGCSLVVLACNTASAESLRKIQKEWLPKHYPSKNVLGVIRPLAEAAAVATKNGRIGVLATRSTVASGSYTRELRHQQENIEVFERSARPLVPLIEEGFAGKPEFRMILKKYLRPLLSQNIDTLILGCTHYDLVASDIRRYVGKKVIVLDSSAIVAEKFVDYLTRHPEYAGTETGSGDRTFLTTGDPKVIAALVKRFWREPLVFKHVTLSHTA